MTSLSTIHSTPKKPSKWHTLFGAKLGFILLTCSVIWLFTPVRFPFHDWSVQRHDKIAEQEFKTECPDYPAVIGNGIADECGRMLFGHPGLEYLTTVYIALAAGAIGIILLAVAGVRRMSRSS